MNIDVISLESESVYGHHVYLNALQHLETLGHEVTIKNSYPEKIDYTLLSPMLARVNKELIWDEADQVIFNLPIFNRPPEVDGKKLRNAIAIFHDILYWHCRFGIHFNTLGTPRKDRPFFSTEQSPYVDDSILFRRAALLMTEEWTDLVNQMRKIVLPSEFMKQFFIARGVNADLIQVLPHPVSMPLVSQARSNGRTDVLIPNLQEKMDLPNVYATIRNNPQVQFIVVCDESDDRAAVFNLISNVTTIPYQPHSKMADLFDHVSTVLFLGLADESFCLTANEALSRGCKFVHYGNGALDRLEDVPNALRYVRPTNGEDYLMPAITDAIYRKSEEPYIENMNLDTYVKELLA